MWAAPFGDHIQPLEEPKESFPVVEEPLSEDYDVYSNETSNESDWSIEDESYVHSPCVVIEEVIEETGPIEAAAKAFVTLFYSLLSRVQMDPHDPIEKKIQRILTLFHPEAVLTLQGSIFRGSAIGHALANSRGYYFEPKSVSIQPSLPEGSILIMVHGLARSKKISKRNISTVKNQFQQNETNNFFEENKNNNFFVQENEKKSQNFIWKRFLFTQIFFLISTVDQFGVQNFFITNSLIRARSGTRF